MKRLIGIAFAALFAVGIANGQTQPTATALKMGGFPISTGLVTFTPVDAGTPGVAGSEKAIVFADATGAQNGPVAFACKITNGAIGGMMQEDGTISGTCSVPDAALTTPANILYDVTVTDKSTGLRTSGLAYTLHTVPSITGATWALDHYAPAANLGNTQPIISAHGGTVPSSCVAPTFFTHDTDASVYTCVAGVFVAISGPTGPTGPTGPAGPPATFRGAWISGTAYSIGDVVSYTNGNSYVSLTAANSGHNPASDMANWAVLATAGANGVASVSALSTLLSKQPFITSNLYNAAANTAGYIDNTDGSFHGGGPAYTASDYMLCNAGGPMASSVAVASFSSPVVGLAFYDQNRTYVSGIAGPVSTWTCPSGAAFVRATFTPATAADVVVAFGSSIPASFDSLTTVAAQSQIARFAQSAIQDNRDFAANLFDTAAVTNGYLLSASDGSAVPDVNHYISGYIRVLGGASYAMALGDPEANPAYGLVWYDVSKNFISSVALPFTNGQTFTAPQGAVFVRFLGNNGVSDLANTIPLQMFTLGTTPAAYRAFGGKPSFNFGHAQFDVNFRFTHKLGLDPTDKIFLCCDSRSSTDYTFNASAMAALTGAQVYNGGWSGHTAAMNASNADMARIYNYAPNVVFALIGGNDSGAPNSVGTFSGAVAGEPTVTQTPLGSDYTGSYFIQAVDYFVRAFNAHYYNIRARAGLTGSESESQKNALIAAVQPKPVLYLTTDIPQQRNNSGDATALPANWQRKHDAIMEVCALDHVQCIDTLALTPFAANMAAEPYWTSPTNTSTNNGVYYMDGLHPNQFGWQILAQLYCWFAGL